MSLKSSFSEKELLSTLNLKKICDRVDSGEFKRSKEPFIRIFKFKVSGLNNNLEDKVEYIGSYIDFDFFSRNSSEERMLNEAQILFKSHVNKLHFSSPEIIEDIVI